MTTTELEQVTRDYILDIYKKEYIGKMHVRKLEPVGYCIELGMSVPEKPIVIYAELEDSKFLKFLREELKSRRFNLVHFGQLKLTYPYDCNPINTSCCDKGCTNRQNG